MNLPIEYSFQRYLAAKKSVDDRALHPYVWQTLARQLRTLSNAEPLRILEIGAGIGTMSERVLERGLVECCHYTAIDNQVENIAAARRRLPEWGRAHGYQVSQAAGSMQFSAGTRRMTLELETLDLFALIEREAGRRNWDVLIAHAFLDLMDIPATLPQIFRLLRPGGFFYFTINFDGVTGLEPGCDPELDELIPALYHQSMDDRLTNGKPAGDSRAGRHLFKQITQAGGEILAAAGSDWVVFPTAKVYPHDEAYFLYYILFFIEQTLSGHPRLDPQRFQNWLLQRRTQIEQGDLVYIAHQLDFAGKRL